MYPTGDISNFVLFGCSIVNGKRKSSLKQAMGYLLRHPELVSGSSVQMPKQVRHDEPFLRRKRRDIYPIGNKKVSRGARLKIYLLRAGDEVRTRDIQLGKLTLYQLSYARSGNFKYFVILF